MAMETMKKWKILCACNLSDVQQYVVCAAVYLASWKARLAAGITQNQEVSSLLFRTFFALSLALQYLKQKVSCLSWMVATVRRQQK